MYFTLSRYQPLVFCFPVRERDLKFWLGLLDQIILTDLIDEMEKINSEQ